VVSLAVRAVTFNARHGVGVDGRLDLDRTATLLARLAPDVVGLQELDQGAERSGRVDQATWLGRALGMQVACGPARQRRPHERVALLSRHPLADARTVWFWNGGRRGGEPRAALVADVLAPTGRLRCVVAHLSTRRWERAGERRALAATVSWLSGPVVVFLDANAARLGPLRRSAGLRPPPGPAPATFPAQRPTKPVDWVLARTPARHLSEARTAPCDVSDHLPLLALVGCSS
jgi:endonuclease/exonuclease/phosphatase family metal-dependent hydrolase